MDFRRIVPLMVGGLGLGGLFFLARKLMSPFDPTNVLPDSALWPYKALDVQAFFQQMGSFLANETWPTDQGPVYISNWLSRWALSENVNPAWLLVRLQAEQSLLSISPANAVELDQTPKTWQEVGDDGKPHPVSGTKLEYQKRWALGFSAFEGGFRPSLHGLPMAGLGNQIRRAAEWTRRMFTNTAHSIPPLVIDGSPLQAKTRATYALYRYTPHIQAAKETQALFKSYFPAFTYT